MNASASSPILLVDDVSIDENVKNKPRISYFLSLHGKLIHPANPKHRDIRITESSDAGPLFVNKGEAGFYFYNDGAVRKLLDRLCKWDLQSLAGISLPVSSNPKGFWVIDINRIEGSV
jgi:hypothetical protein